LIGVTHCGKSFNGKPQASVCAGRADACGLPLNDAAKPQPVDEAGSLVHEMRASQQQVAN